MKISQREAQRLKKRVEELERRERNNINAWSREYIDGVNVTTLAVSDLDMAICMTARKLGHALVLMPRPADRNAVMVYAVKP